MTGAKDRGFTIKVSLDQDTIIPNVYLLNDKDKKKRKKKQN